MRFIFCLALFILFPFDLAQAAMPNPSGCGSTTWASPQCQMYLATRQNPNMFGPFYNTPFYPSAYLRPMIGQMNYYDPYLVQTRGHYPINYQPTPYYYGSPLPGSSWVNRIW